VDVRSRVGGSGFWFAYRQLFLVAQRYFPYMTEIRPRKGRTKTRGRLEDYDMLLKSDVCWNLLAKLALELGFSNVSIQNLRREGLAMSTNFQPEEATPQLAVDAEEEWRFENRCGRVFEQAFRRDRKYMFLDHIYSNSDLSPRQTITSFAVFRHIFHAFFGTAVPSSGSHRNLWPSPVVSHFSPDVPALGSEDSHHGPEDIDTDHSLSPSRSVHGIDEGVNFSPQEMYSEDIDMDHSLSPSRSIHGIDEGVNFSPQEMSSEDITQESPVGGDNDGSVVMQDALITLASPLHGLIDAATIQPVRFEQVQCTDIIAPAAVTSMHGLIEFSSAQDNNVTLVPSQSFVDPIPDPENAKVAPVPNSGSQGSTNTAQLEKHSTTYFPREEEGGNIDVPSQGHGFEEISHTNSSESTKHPEDSVACTQDSPSFSRSNETLSTPSNLQNIVIEGCQKALVPSAGLKLSTDSHSQNSPWPEKHSTTCFPAGEEGDNIDVPARMHPGDSSAAAPSAGLQLRTDSHSQNMINSPRSEKHSTTCFPAGEEGDNTDVRARKHPDDSSAAAPASPSVPQSNQTSHTTSSPQIAMVAPAPLDRVNEGSEKGIVADSIPQAQDPQKHMTTLFPGGRRESDPKSPQSPRSNSQSPLRRPHDDQQASASKTRKRKSWHPIPMPMPVNPGMTAVRYHTSVEQVLRLLEQLRTNSSTRYQLPYCWVEVSDSEYTWNFSSQVDDARVTEKRLREMTEPGKFFTFGDLVRRQFSTINTSLATQYYRRHIPIFIHRVEINFKTAFPPIEEPDRTSLPTIPQWDAKLGKWTSLEIPLASKKAKKLGEMESTSEEEL
jgi:Protein of unknown function (DUF3723)